MAETILRVERQGGVAVVTLNRPAAMNALSLALRRELAVAFEELADDDSVEAVILTGNGRAFCAGLDLKELGQSELLSLEETDDINFVRQIQRLRCPLIGAINGFAITGGLELALFCDFMIASSAAKFADTHARVGLTPGWGLSQKLPRLIGIGRAKEMSFTGCFVSAEQAAHWGLVNRVVEPDALMATALAVAADIVSCNRVAVQEHKRLYDTGWEGTLADGLAMEVASSKAFYRRVNPGDIAERREAVQSAGRARSENK